MLGSMKSDAVLLCLAFALAGTAGAQEVITPTNPIELFNGKDFSGFTFCMKDEAEPLQTWSVTNGLIHCTGKPTGYLRTIQSFREYVLTVEWRFVKIAPQADNTGILLHIQKPDKVWPMCVQVQGKHDHQGDLFLMAGAESKEHRGMGANTAIPLRGESVEHPVGEWNTAEVICRNAIRPNFTNGIPTNHITADINIPFLANHVPTSLITAFINGTLANQTTDCTLTNGMIGIQSEGGEIEIRRMSLDSIHHTFTSSQVNGRSSVGLSDILDARLRENEKIKRELR
jgi:hypothetical protein